MNEGQYLIAKLVTELQNQSSSKYYIASQVARKFQSDIHFAKFVECNIEGASEPNCSGKAYNRAVQSTKKVFARVHLYRKRSEVTTYVILDTYTVFTLISNIGAQMGLWGGLTFITLYDYLFHFSKKIFHEKMGNFIKHRCACWYKICPINFKPDADNAESSYQIEATVASGFNNEESTLGDNAVKLHSFTRINTG